MSEHIAQIQATTSTTMQPMKTLISFSTRWGPQFGGINSFNQDLLQAFAAALSGRVRTVCMVLEASLAEIKDAQDNQVHLLSLDLKNQKEFSDHFAVNTWQVLQRQGWSLDPDQTVWLGHDRITGAIALKAATEYGGRSALIHHMSYDHYESFSENSILADAKAREQQQLFEKANIAIAVGPMLRDALEDMLDRADIPMLVPGLPGSITVKTQFRSFRAFISGRLSEDAKKIKQGHLGVAAFAHAVQKADATPGLPDVLHGSREPELTLRGVDWEHYSSADHSTGENALKLFAEQYAKRAIRMHTLPFTTDRNDLFNDLRSASVAMMPSWHEGFGLVGWEAIAAGVPLIVSKKSGLYRLLEELDHGIYTSLVHPIDIAGSNNDPFFLDKDLEALAGKIIDIAKSPDQARGRAVKLREALLLKYSWRDCATSFAAMLNWAEAPDTAVPATAAMAAPAPAPVTAPQPASNVLEMPGQTWHATAGLSHSWLLRAEEAVIPFDPNREPFLEEQRQWSCSTEYPIAIRLLTGVGGTGKTRLALELCARLHKQGWQTGFLPNDARISTTVENLTATNQPVCLVIDYAETRQSQLLALIKALLNTKPPQAIRILLLARDGGEWWSLLPAKDAACEALLEGMATTGPYMLPQLHDSLTIRQTAYRHALTAFAEKLALPEPPGIAKLDDEHFAHPLYVQMAALLALHGEQPGSAESVARSLIGHERRYWEKAMAAIPDMAAQPSDCAALFMALATLANGLPTTRECEPLWLAAGGEKRQLKPLFAMLAQLYPDRQGVQGLRPDLLGEALVAQCLLNDSGQSLLNALLGSKQTHLRRAALTVVARLLRNREELAHVIEPLLTEHFVACADDLIAVIVETPSPLVRITEKAFSNLSTLQKNQVCGILEKHLQSELIPLIDLAVLMGRVQLAKIEQKTQKITVDYQADKAAALNTLSIRLVWQGQIEEAADKARQSLEIHAKLAHIKPERFESDWAMSLNNYANRLGQLGRSNEAETTAKKALEIYRKLAHANHKQFDSDWAMSLNNYSIYLSELGRSNDAEIHARQALKIHQKLANDKAENSEPNLAGSLGNYANRLSELGRSDEAEARATQARQIYEKLAHENPERFEHYWAMSLSNYARLLSELGRSDEAEVYSRQALIIHEKLTRAKPERFEPDWAMLNNNYASFLNKLGRNDEAETFIIRALEIYKKLAHLRPERFESDWAASLNNYGNLLNDVGRSEESEILSRQTLEIYEKLAHVKPEPFNHLLAESKIFAAICGWLTNKSPLALEYPVTRHSTTHKQRQLNYEYNFLIAITSAEHDRICEAITSAETHWHEMGSSQKRLSESYRLLLAGLAESREISCTLTEGWRDDLSRFRAQRKGQLPWWMLEVSRRAGFSL